jgi:hypothetical protein
MRWMCAALVGVASAGVASGQVLWAGVSVGTSWTWQAPTAPDTNFLHSTDAAPSLFVAFPIDNDTLFRLRAADLPYVPVIDGMGWPGKMRAYTAGVDYLFTGIFGQALISAGLGSYSLQLQARTPPPGAEQTKFGWYFGVGEWLQLSRRSRVTVELTMDRTSMATHPIVVAANLGVAFSF